MPSGRPSTPGSFPDARLVKASGVRKRGSIGGDQDTAAARGGARSPALTLSASMSPSARIACAEQRVELGVQARAVGDPEVGAELQPALADRGAQLDHHLGLAREAGEHVLELPSTDAASAVASRRSRSALGVARLPGLGLLEPRSPPRRSGRKGSICWTTMHVFSRSLWSTRPRTSTIESATSASPAAEARFRTRAARPRPRGRRASRTSSGRPSWSGSSWSR